MIACCILSHSLLTHLPFLVFFSIFHHFVCDLSIAIGCELSYLFMCFCIPISSHYSPPPVMPHFTIQILQNLLFSAACIPNPCTHTDSTQAVLFHGFFNLLCHMMPSTLFHGAACSSSLLAGWLCILMVYSTTTPNLRLPADLSCNNANDDTVTKWRSQQYLPTFFKKRTMLSYKYCSFLKRNIAPPPFFHIYIHIKVTKQTDCQVLVPIFHIH